MRTIIYKVYNKETNEKVYTDCRKYKCEEFIANNENKENLEIRYRWASI